jgi:hypothetical protein
MNGDKQTSMDKRLRTIIDGRTLVDKCLWIDVDGWKGNNDKTDDKLH